MEYLSTIFFASQTSSDAIDPLSYYILGGAALFFVMLAFFIVRHQRHLERTAAKGPDPTVKPPAPMVPQRVTKVPLAEKPKTNPQSSAPPARVESKPPAVSLPRAESARKNQSNKATAPPKVDLKPLPGGELKLRYKPSKGVTTVRDNITLPDNGDTRLDFKGGGWMEIRSDEPVDFHIGEGLKRSSAHAKDQVNLSVPGDPEASMTLRIHRVRNNERVAIHVTAHRG